MKWRYINRILEKILAIALILLIFAITMNNALFVHNHVLPNGEVVQHAHPYSKSDNPGSPYKTHHHSSFEFYLLNNMFSFLWIITLALVIMFHNKIHFISVKKNVFRIAYNYSFSLSRGPPIVF